MAIRNYRELKALIADWMDRQKLASTVPSVIEGVNIDIANSLCTRVESDVNRNLRVEDMVVPMFNVPVNEQSMLVLPDNVLGIRMVLVGGVPAQAITPEQLAQGENFYCGKPLFARMANQLHFYPALAAKEEVTVLPYVTLKPLVNDTDSNWMLAKYPDIYLSGCLHEACMYIRDDEGAALWLGKYRGAMAELAQSDARDIWSGSPLAVRNA